jgi:hypothetical protein
MITPLVTLLITLLVTALIPFPIAWIAYSTFLNSDSDDVGALFEKHREFSRAGVALILKRRFACWSLSMDVSPH